MARSSSCLIRGSRCSAGRQEAFQGGGAVERSPGVATGGGVRGADPDTIARAAAELVPLPGRIMTGRSFGPTGRAQVRGRYRCIVADHIVRHRDSARSPTSCLTGARRMLESTRPEAAPAVGDPGQAHAFPRRGLTRELRSDHNILWRGRGWPLFSSSGTPASAGMKC